MMKGSSTFVRSLGYFFTYNPHIPNIDAISGALISLSLSILKLNFQCKEGARDGIVICYMWIIVYIRETAKKRIGGQIPLSNHMIEKSADP